MASSDLSTKEEPCLAIKAEPESPQAPETGQEPTKPKKGPTTCGVCDAAASKYKCSRCYFPYCSIACNKVHQENHPPDPKPDPNAEPPSAPLAEPLAEPPRSLNPFRALDESEKLAWLFRKYPTLPQQLLDIHAVTQPPPEDPSKQIPASLRQGLPSRNMWSQEQGISRGKAALRRARQQPGEAGEAIREYCTLISLLLNEEEAKTSARAVLQQQLAQKDADTVRQLLEAEQNRR